MNPSILSIATAVPPHLFYQSDIDEKLIEATQANEEQIAVIRRMHRQSAIHKRYSVLPDFKESRKDWNFWGVDYPISVPGMSARNDMYKKEAPKLAHEAASKALQKWGGDPAAITHIISVSCTGVIAPGIEFELAQSLNLKPSVQRFGVNFMGCFGAFKGLSIANAFAKENKNHRILVVCTELCSLHLQAHLDLETITANSLFSDGAAAVIVGLNPQANETSMWTIENNYSIGLSNSLNKMTWEASDHGFLMRLSPTVPVLIGRHIQPFIASLLKADLSPLECDWAIHPGGKSIIQAVEKALRLDKSHTFSSWNTLANYGNMSSSTFLFVLEELYQSTPYKEWTVGVGFGPGLSMEGLLLYRRKKKD